MATLNISISDQWTKLADSANLELLVTWNDPISIEVATTTADTAPIVNGHRLFPNDAITRTVIGSGYVWARLVSGSRSNSANLVVTK